MVNRWLGLAFRRRANVVETPPSSERSFRARARLGVNSRSPALPSRRPPSQHVVVGSGWSTAGHSRQSQRQSQSRRCFDGSAPSPRRLPPQLVGVVVVAPAIIHSLEFERARRVGIVWWLVPLFSEYATHRRHGTSYGGVALSCVVLRRISSRC